MLLWINKILVEIKYLCFNPISANPTSCLSVFHQFVGLALKGLSENYFHLCLGSLTFMTMQKKYDALGDKTVY